MKDQSRPKPKSLIKKAVSKTKAPATKGKGSKHKIGSHSASGLRGIGRGTTEDAPTPNETTPP